MYICINKRYDKFWMIKAAVFLYAIQVINIRLTEPLFTALAKSLTSRKFCVAYMKESVYKIFLFIDNMTRRFQKPEPQGPC